MTENFLLKSLAHSPHSLFRPSGADSEGKHPQPGAQQGTEADLHSLGCLRGGWLQWRLPGWWQWRRPDHDWGREEEREERVRLHLLQSVLAVRQGRGGSPTLCIPYPQFRPTKHQGTKKQRNIMTINTNSLLASICHLKEIDQYIVVLYIICIA